MSLPHPSLIGMPPETLDKICKTLDYKEILGLRTVCRHLKNFVDINRPDFHFKYIIVNVITNGFFVYFGNDVKEIYKKNHMKSLMTVVGDEDMWGPLERVLTHQRSPLAAFQLNCEWEENAKDSVKVLEKVRTILISTNRLFQVKCFGIHVQNEDQVMRILPLLDPEVIRSIYLKDMLPLSLKKEKKPIGMEKIKESNHWKNSSEFGAVNFFTNSKIEDFNHFNRISITMHTLRMSEVNMLKEKIFNSPKGHSAYIKYSNLVRDTDIAEGHLPITDRDVYEYPIPNQNRFVYLKLFEGCFHIEIHDNRTLRLFGGPIDVNEMDDEW